MTKTLCSDIHKCISREGGAGVTGAVLGRGLLGVGSLGSHRPPPGVPRHGRVLCTALQPRPSHYPQRLQAPDRTHDALLGSEENSQMGRGMHTLGRV